MDQDDTEGPSQAAPQKTCSAGKLRTLEFGRYPDTEPTPTVCNEKCSKCSRRCSATFAHEHHSCRGCFEKDNEAVTCQECDRPLQDYAGSAKHHGKCPNCDAHVREEGVHEKPRRPEDELMSPMLPSIPDPPTSKEPTKQPEGLSGSSQDGALNYAINTPRQVKNQPEAQNERGSRKASGRRRNRSG